MSVWIVLVLSLLITAYLYATRHFNYWKNREIVFIKPRPFIGNLGPLLTLKISIGEYLREIYNKYDKCPYVGIFLADKPCLIVRDFELVNRILKNDFNYFSNRIITLSKKTDYIGSRSLFVMHGNEWKNARAKLSPIFTARKQKAVFDAMLGVGKKFEEKLDKESSINIKLLSSCFAVDTISEAVLRLKGGAIKDPYNDPMRKFGERLFEESLNHSLRFNMVFLLPELMEKFKISLFPNSVYNVMRDAVKFAIDRKAVENIHRGDYIDSLLELRAKGSWEGNNGEAIVFDDEIFVAQFFMFFTAGYETAGSGVLYCLFEAAKDKDIQEKLKAEIKHYMKLNGGNISYESINEMSYLNKFINECLRKHPPFPFIDRYCTKDYTIPGTNVVINKGIKLLIPMLGLQNDELYYDNPESIIPERFDDMDSIKGKPYFPFGDGPRTCLGMRFAQQLLRISVFSALKDHTLTLSENTPEVLKSSPRRFGTVPLNDVILDVHKDV